MKPHHFIVNPCSNPLSWCGAASVGLSLKYLKHVPDTSSLATAAAAAAMQWLMSGGSGSLNLPVNFDGLLQY